MDELVNPTLPSKSQVRRWLK